MLFAVNVDKMAPAEGKRAHPFAQSGVTSTRKRPVVKKDGIEEHSPSTPDRNVVVQLLAKTLSGSLEDEPDVKHVASDIEQELFQLHNGCNKSCKTAVRNLVANLKRNDVLVRRVRSGELPAAELVRLDVSQLATPQQQEQWAKRQDHMLKMATLTDTDSLTEDYHCPECKSHQCSYMDSGVRDVGKSETWGAKFHEHGSRTITCLSCGHKWETDLL